MNKAILIFGVSAGIALGAQAQISFEPGVAYAAGITPEASALGDFDGDGDLDLATTGDGPDKVTFQRNNGDGTFANATTLNLASGSSPHAIVAGLFDGDADLDLAVTLKNTGLVQILNNDGTGTFTAGLTYAVGVEPRAMVAGDLNKDGRADLVVSNRDSNNLTVLMSQVVGFSTTTYPTGIEPREVDLGDFTSDTWLDIAVAVADDRRIELFRYQAGAFVFHASLSTSPLKPEGLAAGDLDGNGEIDLAMSGSNNNVEWAGVFLNSGGAIFSGRNDYALSGQNASSMVAAVTVA